VCSSDLGVSDPTNASDAVNKGWIDGDRIGGMTVLQLTASAGVETVNIGGFDVSPATAPFTTSGGTNPSNVRSNATPARTYRGVAIFSSEIRSIFMNNVGTSLWDSSPLPDLDGSKLYTYIIFRQS
jgi:hypothetical protein